MFSDTPVFLLYVYALLPEIAELELGSVSRANKMPGGIALYRTTKNTKQKIHGDRLSLLFVFALVSAFCRFELVFVFVP